MKLPAKKKLLDRLDLVGTKRFCRVKDYASTVREITTIYRCHTRCQNQKSPYNVHRDINIEKLSVASGLRVLGTAKLFKFKTTEISVKYRITTTPTTNARFY